ncbi:hypothetical protein OE88DRAFT_1662293 [Heliocybe sulcata]|uniref:Uncharacterized protein n=1 Tax=Heliocybe sulcata TaxID=5364 RepID=A0A5C3MWK1_9AGAM|nr:hypothetical protein OE88DRAFT_1662293 [Heliocybe sulcata]
MSPSLANSLSTSAPSALCLRLRCQSSTRAVHAVHLPRRPHAFRPQPEVRRAQLRRITSEIAHISAKFMLM